jgi:hypothetical protein
MVFVGAVTAGENRRGRLMAAAPLVFGPIDMMAATLTA